MTPKSWLDREGSTAKRVPFTYLQSATRHVRDVRSWLKIAIGLAAYQKSRPTSLREVANLVGVPLPTLYNARWVARAVSVYLSNRLAYVSNLGWARINSASVAGLAILGRSKLPADAVCRLINLGAPRDACLQTVRKGSVGKPTANMRSFAAKQAYVRDLVKAVATGESHPNATEIVRTCDNETIDHIEATLNAYATRCTLFAKQLALRPKNVKSYKGKKAA